MKLFLVKDYRLFKNRKKVISYWIHILGLSTFLLVFPTNKVLSGYPSLLPTTARLNLSYTQCKAKANEVANLVFSNVKLIPERNNYFQLFGATTRTISVLICIKSDRGTYFILSTSSDGFSDTNSEYKSVYQRVNQYMLSD